MSRETNEHAADCASAGDACMPYLPCHVCGEPASLANCATAACSCMTDVASRDAEACCGCARAPPTIARLMSCQGARGVLTYRGGGADVLQRAAAHAAIQLPAAVPPQPFTCSACSRRVAWPVRPASCSSLASRRASNADRLSACTATTAAAGLPQLCRQCPRAAGMAAWPGACSIRPRAPNPAPRARDVQPVMPAAPGAPHSQPAAQQRVRQHSCTRLGGGKHLRHE